VTGNDDKLATHKLVDRTGMPPHAGAGEESKKKKTDQKGVKLL